jgi:hypothetical protein
MIRHETQDRRPHDLQILLMTSAGGILSWSEAEIPAWLDNEQ